MKYKHQARAAGVFRTLLFSAITYGAATNMLAPDIPLYQRAIHGTFAFAGSSFTIDGLIDIVKGTHHYFSVVLCKHAATIMGNKSMAQKAESELEGMLDYREQNHVPFAGFWRKG